MESSPSLIAAAIGGIGSILGGLAGYFGSKYLRSDDIVRTNLAAQLESWRDLANMLEGRTAAQQNAINSLEQRCADYRASVEKCERDSARMRHRIAVLEHRLGLNPNEEW